MSWTRTAKRRLDAILAALTLAAAGFAATADAATVTRIQTGRADLATFVLSGSIEKGDLVRFQAAVSKLPAATRVAVILNSPGGDLFEGLALGVFFHQARITTMIQGSGGICYSSCSLAFLGGRDARTGQPMRIKTSGGKLGFHQFRRTNYDPLKVYTKDDFAQQVVITQAITHDIVRYLKTIGEDLSKLQFMLRAPHEEINLIPDSECLKQGISVLDEATGRLIDATTLRQRLSALN